MVYLKKKKRLSYDWELQLLQRIYAWYPKSFIVASYMSFSVITI